MSENTAQDAQIRRLMVLHREHFSTDYCESLLNLMRAELEAKQSGGDTNLQVNAILNLLEYQQPSLATELSVIDTAEMAVRLLRQYFTDRFLVEFLDLLLVELNNKWKGETITSKTMNELITRLEPFYVQPERQRSS